MNHRPKPQTKPEGPDSQVLKSNLAFLAERESAALAERTPLQKFCVRFTSVAGEPWFFGLHVFWFTGWIVVNVVLESKAFDPFPFLTLRFIISVEAIFLSLAIMMSQRLENRHRDERAKLDLQVSLLVEREATLTLKMISAICKSLGLKEADDPELADLLQPTHAEVVLEQLEQAEQKHAENEDETAKS